MNPTFHKVSESAVQRGIAAWLAAPNGYVMTIAPPKRTLEQNAAQWPVLACFAEQLQWPINGRLETLLSSEWKDILTAAFSQEAQRVSPGLNGGMVLLGQRTSEFGKSRFGEWLEFLHATAADRGIELTPAPANVEIPPYVR